MSQLHTTTSGRLSKYHQPDIERYQRILAERNEILKRLDFKAPNRLKQHINTKEYILANSVIDPLTGCRVWARSLQNVGYGFMSHRNHENKSSMATVHRVAYEEWNGPIPKGMVIGHTCDTTYCCEPSHLVLFTRSENMQDSIKKGRFSTGSHFKSTVECPHCGQTGRFSIMHKHHFDNCKEFPVMVEAEEFVLAE
jgi:hypothetical protein